MEVFDIFGPHSNPCADWGEILHTKADPRARRPRQVWRESVLRGILPVINTTFSHLQPARVVQSSPNFAWR